MRLLRCHIENFGKLSDLTLDFEQGLNVICRENGWGKSTLAAFLKVMLYGFGEEKSRDEFKNERKRFFPWQGGVYGGSLEFEAGGRRYVVNRTFGAKEREDRFSLREADTNLESNDYSVRLGEELFSLDCSSFCRTVFVSQSDCETVSTDAVNAKIGNLAEATDDINNFESANQRFLNLLNQLSPTRKTGALYRKKEELTRLQMEVRAGEGVLRALEEAGGRLAEKQMRQRQMQEEQALLLQKQKEAGERKELLAKREAYEALCRSMGERKEAYERERAYFPGELPEKEKLREQIGESLELAAVKESVRLSGMTPEESREYAALRLVFAQGMPEKNRIQEWEEKAANLQAQRIALAESRPDPQDEERFLSYQARFAEGMPQPEEVDRLMGDWKRCLEKKSVLEQKRIHFLTLQELDRGKEQGKPEKKDTGRGMFLILAGALFLFAGICLAGLRIGGPLPGILLAGFGAGCLAVRCAGSFLQKGGKSSPPQEEAPRERTTLERFEQEILQDEAFIQKTQGRTEEFLERYGILWEREEDILDCLYGFKGQIRDYITLSNRRRLADTRQMEEEAGRLDRELSQFLSGYFPGTPIPETEYPARLHELKEMAASCERLQKKEKQYARSMQEYRSRLAALETFVRSLGMEPEPEGEDLQAKLLQAQSHLQSLEASRREYEDARAKKEAFEEREPMEAILGESPGEGPEESAGYAARIEELSRMLEQMYQAVAEENRQILSLREEADRIEEEKKALEVLQEEYQRQLERYRLLQKSRELLEQAKISFTARYTAPIRKSLGNYFTLLSGESGERLHVDANTKVTLDEQGMQREPRFFSAGYRDLLGICMRMALVDAMYKEEKPFVIFDDPFANLDGEKLSGAGEVLKQIGEQYQVLYFTCHESRCWC